MATLKEGPDLATFCHPGNLSRLALWLVDALRDKVTPLGTGKKKSLPLVVACLDEKHASYIVVGVMAAVEMGDVRKKCVANLLSLFWFPDQFESQFGLAFLDAKAKANAKTRHGSFETNVVEVDKDDLVAFMTALQLYR